MYAVGHTKLQLVSLSDSAIAKVRARIAKCKIKDFKNGAAYRVVIRNEKWSFFQDYNEAKSHQLLLNMFGNQS
jgi:hypothetical protein